MANYYIKEPQLIVALPREEGGYNVAFRNEGLEFIYMDKKFYQIDLPLETRKEFFEKYGKLRQDGREEEYNKKLKDLYDTKGTKEEQKIITEGRTAQDIVEELIK